jgi:hypothetical protein
MGTLGSLFRTRWMALVAIATAVALAVASCSGADGLPRIVGSAGGAERSSADAALAIGMFPTDYVLADGVDVAAGEVDAWRWSGPDESAVADLAARLGVAGQPVAVPADEGGGWRVEGDTTLWVGPDGSWWWNERGDVAVTTCVSAGESSSSDAVDPPDDPVSSVGGPDDLRTLDACVDEFAPPPDLPDDATALDAARRIAGEGDVGDIERNEWAVSVPVTYRIDGRPSGFTGGWSWGVAGASASGYLGDPTPVGPYPTLSARDALERLSTGYGTVWPAAGGADVGQPEPMPMVEPLVTVDGESTDPSDPVPGGGGASAPASPPDPGIAVDPSVVDPSVVDPSVVDPGVIDEPLAVVVELVSVEPTLVAFWDVDGTRWSLPGYAYRAADGGLWEVVAVTDEYFGVDVPPDVSPPVTTTGGAGDDVDGAPGAVDGDPGVGGGGDSGGDSGGDVGIVEPSPGAPEVIGLFEAEAAIVLGEAGFTVRVVERDGEAFPVTKDFRSDRANLVVRDGAVADVWFG